MTTTTKTAHDTAKDNYSAFVTKNGSDVTKLSGDLLKEHNKLVREISKTTPKAEKVEDPKRVEDKKEYTSIAKKLNVTPSDLFHSFEVTEIAAKDKETGERKVNRIVVGLKYRKNDRLKSISAYLSPKTEKLEDVIEAEKIEAVRILSLI
jgi:hypothetical protein